MGVEVSHQSSNQNRYIYGSILHGVVDLRIKYVDTSNDLDSRTFPIPIILSRLPANRTMQLGEKAGKDANNITKTTRVCDFEVLVIKCVGLSGEFSFRLFGGFLIGLVEMMREH